MAEVGVEHRRVVGGDGAADAGRHESRERVLLERGDHARAEVGDRADVEHGAAAGQLADETRILLSPDAVTDAMRAERIERASHRVGTGGLSRVRDRREPTFAGDGERALVELRRVLGLEAAEPEADDAAVAVGDRVAGSRLCFVVGVAARDVRRQAYLDAVQLPRLLGAVAIAGEHLVAVDLPP